MGQNYAFAPEVETACDEFIVVAFVHKDADDWSVGQPASGRLIVNRVTGKETVLDYTPSDDLPEFTPIDDDVEDIAYFVTNDE